MVTPAFSKQSRICASCGVPFMAEFSTCERCGTSTIATTPRTRARRETRLDLSWLIPLVLIAALGGGIYAAIPTVLVCFRAMETPVAEPITVGDKMHNDDIFEARRTLGWE